MDRRLKRPSDGEPSESSQRQRVEGQTSGGFASGPVGRRYLPFTSIARGAYDQAGPSRQEAGRLNYHERGLIEHSKRYIARSGSDAWHNLIASIGPNTQAFFRDLVSKLPVEEQRIFDIQQPEGSRRQQIEEIHHDMAQQHEIYGRVNQNDYLKRNTEDIMQIQHGYIEHKKMQGHLKNEDIAQSFFASLPDKYRQELMEYCATGVGSHDTKQIYQRWYELYRGT